MAKMEKALTIFTVKAFIKAGLLSVRALNKPLTITTEVTVMTAEKHYIPRYFMRSILIFKIYAYFCMVALPHFFKRYANHAIIPQILNRCPTRRRG